MQQRRRLTSTPKAPVTAMISAVAVLASAVVGVSTNNILRTDGTAIEPVTASVGTSSLADGASVVVDDAAIAAQGEDGTGPRTVKEFTRDQPFSQFAVTWTGDRDLAAFVRAERPDGTWSEWYDTDAYNFGDASDTAVRGTELIYIEPTQKVQVSISGVDLTAPAEATATTQDAGLVETPAEEPAAEEPAPAEQPSGATAPLPSNFGEIRPVTDVEDTAGSAENIDVVFIDGGTSELPENGIQLTNDAAGMPRVISRAGWGANESLKCRDSQYFDGVSGITIHHTAGSNNYSEAQAPGIVRGIYQYHAQQLGWCDVGYHVLADKYGNLYEGRKGGLNKDVWGAHAGGFNENTWAISMLGNYDTTPTTAEMIQAVGDIAGWRAAVAGIDPTGTSTHISEGTSYSKYARGTRVSLPNIFAHRDVGNTACPGQYGYAQMGNIRTIAKTKYDAIKSGAFATATGTSASATASAAATAAPTATPSAVPTTTASAPTTTQRPAPAPATRPSPAPAPAPVVPAAIAGAGSSEIIPTLGALVAAGLGLAASQGLLPGGVSNVGDVQVMNNLKLSDLPGVINEVVALTGDDNIARAWQNVNRQLGPVLGDARSGTHSYIGGNGSPTNFALFDNGIIVEGSTGTNALWGKIGDTWAAQGFDFGPLGLPLNQEYRINNKLRVDFEGGYITFDPATGKVDVQLT